MSNPLLARHAEYIFWLARFVERAENLARILEVNETFSHDRSGSRNWLSIVRLNADEQSFFAKHAAATAATVTGFYLADADNPTSIVSAACRRGGFRAASDRCSPWHARWSHRHPC